MNLFMIAVNGAAYHARTSRIKEWTRYYKAL
jgi:hypothetical protein